MQWSPKRTPYRKRFRGVAGGVRPNLEDLRFGDCGLQVLQSGVISARTLETVRRVFSRRVRKGGQLWFRVFPDIPVSRKSAEVRMGKGKGAVDHWVARVQRGSMVVELAGVPRGVAQELATIAGCKLPMASRLVVRATPTR